MLLDEIARTSRAVAGASARRAKIELLAACLRDAGPAEVPVAVAYLSGELPQRQIGVGYAALRDLPPPADEPSLTVAAVDADFTRIGEVSGKGSVARRRELLAGLLGRATQDEQDFLIRLLAGELRQGALDGVMADAVAKAAEVPAAEVRRAVMLRGALGAVATAALAEGAPGLRSFGLEVGRPIRPMLAASAPSMEEAFTKLATIPGPAPTPTTAPSPPPPTPNAPQPSPNTPQASTDTPPTEASTDAARSEASTVTAPAEANTDTTEASTDAPPASADAALAEASTVAARVTSGDAGGADSAGVGAGFEVAVEWKLDGVRAQIHIAGEEVRVFTRTLDDITDRLPDVVAAVRELPVRAAVLDGELIALRPDGTPHPFQVTAARVGTRTGTAWTPESVPLSVFLFDVLHLDGEDLIDRPGAERYDALSRAVPESLRMPRLVVPVDAGVPAATELFGEAVARGHEGVVVKSLATPYVAGRRGAGWIKVKPRHTLDLVVLAVERGHGRRQGYLSNLHLGARDPETGGFMMLGKTFKGLTDKLLAWQTEKLGELAVEDDGWVVRVRPELVVEIAFDGVQRSTRYPGGMALRFARVLGYRPDKRPAEADTVDTVRTIAAASWDAPEEPET